MVASIGVIASPAQGASYYERDGNYAKEDPAHREANRWAGIGVEPPRGSDMGVRVVMADEPRDPVDDLAMFHVVGRTRPRCPGGSVELDGRRLLHACSCNTEQ